MAAHVPVMMERFWQAFQLLEPTAVLGGIYAPKPGYHNFRDALPKNDYSVQLAADKQGRGDLAAAIDLTFPDAQSGRYETIASYAGRLLRSGMDLNDPRGDRLREFYGQADADTQVEGWDFQALIPVTSDGTHLWHIHLSFLREWLEDWETYSMVLSILAGETVQQWLLAGTEREAMYVVNVSNGTHNWQFVTDGVGNELYLDTEALKWWRDHGAIDVGTMTDEQALGIFGITVPPVAPETGTVAIDYDKLAQALLRALVRQ